MKLEYSVVLLGNRSGQTRFKHEEVLLTQYNVGEILSGILLPEEVHL